MPGTNPPHFPAEDSIWANQQDLDYNLDFTYQNAARRYATHCQPYVTPTPAEQVAEERQSSDLFPTITNYVPYSCPFGHQDVYSSSYQPELNVSQGFDLYEQPVRQHLVPVSTGQSYARTLVRPFALTTSDASVQMGASKFVDPRNGLEYNFAPRPESRPNSARVAQPPLQQIQTTPLNNVQTEPKRIVRKFAQTWTETQRVRAAPKRHLPATYPPRQGATQLYTEPSDFNGSKKGRFVQCFEGRKLATVACQNYAPTFTAPLEEGSFVPSSVQVSPQQIALWQPMIPSPPEIYAPAPPKKLIQPAPVQPYRIHLPVVNAHTPVNARPNSLHPRADPQWQEDHMNVAQLIHAHPHPPARTHPGYPEVTCENPVDCSIQQSSPELTNLHSTTTYDRHPNTHLAPPTIHPRISDVPTLPPLPQQIPNSILSSKVRTHPGYEEVPYGSPNHRSPPDYTYDQLPQTPSNSAFEVYGERKKRRIKVTDDGKMIEHREQLTDLQKRELNEMFRKSSYVDVARLSTIAKELGLEQKKITTWFQNKRYNMKKKEEKEGKKTTRGKEAERKVKNKDEAKGGEKEDVENAKEET